MKFLNSLLPIFPEISENLSKDLLSITFFSELLDKTAENIDGFRGYQVFVQRFLSPLTPYRELLIKHSMGSGKTCTAFLVILSYTKYFRTQNCLVLVNNKSQIKNIRSLLKKCVVYLNTKDYEKKVIENYIEKHIEFRTFDNVSKKKEKLQHIQVIIVDEAHTIHDKTAEGALYSNMMLFLDDARKRQIRIILMTGTPITNHFSKLFQLMDLILPKELRFETYEARYNIKKGQEEQEQEKNINNFYFEKGSLKKESEREIKKRLYGRVSSFQIIHRTTKVLEMGEFYNFETRTGEPTQSGSTSKSKVFINVMKGSQREEYMKLLVQEEPSEQKEISLAFFAPDLLANQYRIENQFLRIKSNVLSENIRDLEQHSILYYNVLKEMGEIDDDEAKQKEAAFYFNDLVRGSANMLFSHILQKRGFEYLLGNESISTLLTNLKHDKATKRKRFVVISSDFGTTSDNEIDKIIQIYTHPSNLYGEYLRIIIGSKKIALGYNLINGRQVHVILQWNSPLMNQAIARVIRGKTNFSNESDNYVKIYKHFITPGGLTDQKDILFERRLKKVEEKEDKNAKILHIVDKVAVDCFVNQKYHVSNSDLDFTTDCNLLRCSENYDCGKKPEIFPKTDNSFLFVEDDNKFNKLSDTISDLVKTNVYSVEIPDLYSMCPNFTENEFYFYLSKIITEQIVFEDALGFYKICGTIYNVLFFKDKPFISSDIEKISYITVPKFLTFNYSPLEVDKFFICNKEQDKVVKLLTSNMFNTNDYDNLNILTKTWLFEIVFPTSDNINNNIKNQLKEKEKNNFVENPTKDILMVHKLISEYHLKGHKVKKPEDLVEGLRIFINGNWKDAVVDAIELSKSLLEKEQGSQEIKVEIPQELEFVFVKEKGIIKRKKGSGKGRACTTLLQSELNDYFEKYISKFRKHSKEPVVLRKEFQNAKIGEKCEILFKLQQDLFKNEPGAKI
jgi:SNF2 family N-terminal domain.